MALRSTEISALLRERKGTFEEDNVGGCGVCFVMFQEPAADDPFASAGERCLNWAVKMFQPSPPLSHCELLMPPVPSEEGERTQFATYLGRKSAWQTNAADNYRFYLVDNADRWRAVPVFSANAAACVREECDTEIGVQYSMLRYLSATRPLRVLAGLLSDARGAPAHCATLTSRILRNAVGVTAHPSAWYGPSSLYEELSETAARRAEALGAAAQPPAEVAHAVEQLLRAPMTRDTVAGVGDEGCMGAARHLTLRCVGALANGDTVAARLAQKQLATVLLRWVVLRDK